MAKKSAPIIRNLQMEQQAVATLIDHLKHLAVETETAETDDAALVKDMIEGETDFFAVIDAAIESVATDSAHIDGLKALQEKILIRLERKQQRIEMTKAAIFNALETAGQERHEGPLATISIGNNPAKVIVSDESTIPAKFWKQPEPPPPALDKRALLEYFKERNEAIAGLAKMAEADRPAALLAIGEKYPHIPGAEMSNDSKRLNVRFK
jgi:hypothetical protein